jgi:8-oxo-dGTP pyrophosphatase MutT (NUDIX family)
MTDDMDRKFADRIAAGRGDATVLIPAATVILLRDSAEGLETLMLRKNSKIAFGGMWVFPGGRLDDEDGPGLEMEARARIAAAREAEEEASLQVDPSELVWFSHWTPPQVEIRRFETWFFAARAPSGSVAIDDGEITDSKWLTPSAALELQQAKEIELVPPTFVTLHYLRGYDSVETALAGLAVGGPRRYVTKIAGSDEGMVALWQGDAGYDEKDPSRPGPRHRLTMAKRGFQFDDSALG